MKFIKKIVVKFWEECVSLNAEEVIDIFFLVEDR